MNRLETETFNTQYKPVIEKIVKNIDRREDKNTLTIDQYNREYLHIMENWVRKINHSGLWLELSLLMDDVLVEDNSSTKVSTDRQQLVSVRLPIIFISGQELLKDSYSLLARVEVARFIFDLWSSLKKDRHEKINI